jgi:cyclic-di-GMP-binding biofilm dispersal mediator protein
LAILALELRRDKIRVINARPGHTETGLATRVIFGTAPAMPPGMDPARVVSRLLAAIVGDETDLPSEVF